MTDLIIGADNVSASYVVFGDIPPVLVNNSFYVWSGGKIALNTYDWSRMTAIITITRWCLLPAMFPMAIFLH